MPELHVCDGRLMPDVNTHRSYFVNNLLYSAGQNRPLSEHTHEKLISVLLTLFYKSVQYVKAECLNFKQVENRASQREATLWHQCQGGGVIVSVLWW